LGTSEILGEAEQTKKARHSLRVLDNMGTGGIADAVEQLIKLSRTALSDLHLNPVRLHFRTKLF